MPKAARISFTGKNLQLLDSIVRDAIEHVKMKCARLACDSEQGQEALAELDDWLVKYERVQARIALTRGEFSEVRS